MERRAIEVHGIVQGVGFRPFVYGLASRLSLGGFVRNEPDGVKIEVEGETGPLEQFLSQLVSDRPPLAHIEDISWRHRRPHGERAFEIRASGHEPSDHVAISPDMATCADCLAELFNPRDRRYRYPFINCTNCGPRLTIVTGAPYDREQTTMAGFAMCPACLAEFENPRDRRFHAQPIACPICGPRLAILNTNGRELSSDPLETTVEAIRAGKIVGVKGLGGYHVACDARNCDAVARLRLRKHRQEKPFAVMVHDLAAASELCEIGPDEQALLTSPRRPIVLLPKRQGSGVAEEVAPGNPWLGVMLPYTPLHSLLLHDLEGMPLVMTSGNQSDEPIVTDEPEAIERLQGIADLFLVHNRPIYVRCDDSVTRIIAKSESPVRRSRGYVPMAVSLPLPCPENILATGGQMKATFALGVARRAIVSHHLGDLDEVRSYVAFERDIATYEQLFAVRPTCIVHDLHPDYASTRYAIERESNDGLKRLAIQHHHAHVASCMAENGVTEPVIGVAFDGTGFGTDGAIWGGEFFVGDCSQFGRVAHLRYVPMPGGERAIREPWRMAAAHLVDADLESERFAGKIPAASFQTMRKMIDRRLNAPMTSSVGRLFDAVAALIGVRDCVSYEGQAAMQLEWLATSVCHDKNNYPVPICEGASENDQSALMIIDTRSIVSGVVEDLNSGVKPAQIARRFHSTIAQLIVSVCMQLRKSTGINIVALSGGVFMNALLSTEASAQLEQDNFRVLRHRLVPPNDGGLSLGQLAIGASQLTAH